MSDVKTCYRCGLPVSGGVTIWLSSSSTEEQYRHLGDHDCIAALRADIASHESHAKTNLDEAIRLGWDMTGTPFSWMAAEIERLRSELVAEKEMGRKLLHQGSQWEGVALCRWQEIENLKAEIERLRSAVRDRECERMRLAINAAEDAAEEAGRPEGEYLAKSIEELAKEIHRLRAALKRILDSGFDALGDELRRIAEEALKCMTTK